MNAQVEKISDEQNDLEEQLCRNAKALALIGVSRFEIVQQVDLALAELGEQVAEQIARAVVKQVRCIEADDEDGLTHGKVYDVVSIGQSEFNKAAVDYVVIDDFGHHNVVISERFEDVGIEEHLLEAEAFADYERVKGKVVHVRYVTGYIDDTDEQVEVTGDILVRIDRDADPRNIRNWRDEWLDPIWDCTVIAGPPKAMRLRSTWTDGISYCTNGKTEGEYRLETLREKLNRWFSRRKN